MNLHYFKPLLTRTGSTLLAVLSIISAGTSYAEESRPTPNTDKPMPWELTDDSDSHSRYVNRYNILTSDLNSDILHGYDEDVKEAYVVIDTNAADAENPVKNFYLHLKYTDDTEVALSIGVCHPSASGTTELICHKADLNGELAQSNVLLAGDVLKTAKVSAVMIPCYQQGKMETLKSYSYTPFPFVDTFGHEEPTPVLHSFALTMEFQGTDTSPITAFDPVNYRRVGASCHNAYGNSVAF